MARKPKLTLGAEKSKAVETKPNGSSFRKTFANVTKPDAAEMQDIPTRGSGYPRSAAEPAPGASFEAAAVCWHQRPEVERQRLLDNASYEARVTGIVRALRAAAIAAAKTGASGGVGARQGSSAADAEGACQNVEALLSELRVAAYANAFAHTATLEESAGAHGAEAASRGARAKHGHLQKALLFSKRAVQLCGAALDSLDDAERAPRKKAEHALPAALRPIAARLTSMLASAKGYATAVRDHTQTAVGAGGSAALNALASVAVVATRGKTGEGRLRGVDALLCRHLDMGEWAGDDRDRRHGEQPIVVDLGFGETPATAVDFAEVISRTVVRRFPKLSTVRPVVLGVEADRSRASGASHWLQCARQRADTLKQSGECGAGVAGPAGCAPELDKARQVVGRSAADASDAGVSTVQSARSTRAKSQWGSHRRLPPRVELDFRCGGFALPLVEEELARLVAIKAMNVLRQYSLAAAEKAVKGLLTQLQPGGILVEGGSDPKGDLASVWILRRSAVGPPQASLCFIANLRSAVVRRDDGDNRHFDPLVFLRSDGLRTGGAGECVPVLPRTLWELRQQRGTKISRFFELWAQCCEETREKGVMAQEQQAAEKEPCRNCGIRAHFVAAARVLASRLSSVGGLPGSVKLRKSLLRRGILCWEGAPYST